MYTTYEQHQLKDAAAAKAEALVSAIVSDAGAVHSWQRLNLSLQFYQAILADAERAVGTDVEAQLKYVGKLNTVVIDALVFEIPDKMTVAMFEREWPIVLAVINTFSS
jgi:hypothetical protein